MGILFYYWIVLINYFIKMKLTKLIWFLVVISDSEEEDKVDIYTEVTLPPNSNSSSRRNYFIALDFNFLFDNYFLVC